MSEVTRDRDGRKRGWNPVRAVQANGNRMDIPSDLDLHRETIGCCGDVGRPDVSFRVRTYP